MAKKTPKKRTNSNGVSVITLRIDQSTKARLIEYSNRRRSDEGRAVSINQCVIELINAGA
jgi:hypothetical protein